MIVRLERALFARPDDRLFPAFIGLFAAYLFLRGTGYEPLRLVIPAAVLIVPGPTRRFAALGALAVESLALARFTYLLSNHGFLEALVLALLAAVPSRDEAGRTAILRAAGLMLIVLFVWAGLKKLIYGYYLSGEYFIVEVAQPSKFSDRLRLLLGAVDRAHLADYHRALLRFAEGPPGVFGDAIPRLGAIPAISALFCAITLVAELVLPLLLIPRRTRTGAVIGIALFVLGVEALALEWAFALLVGVMLVPFLPADRWSPPDRSHPRPPAASAGPERRPFSALAAAAVIAWTSLWPLVQLGLTRTRGLDPWKLGGFGMYAVPGRWETSRIEVRRGQGGFAPLARRPRGSRDPWLETLMHAPFATSAVKEVAAKVRADIPGVDAVRVRSRTVEHDASLDRFRLTERIYVDP